jgi:hypothetical protein
MEQRANHKGNIKFSRTNYSIHMSQMTYYKPWVVEMERFWHLVCGNLTSFKFFSLFFPNIFVLFSYQQCSFEGFDELFSYHQKFYIWYILHLAHLFQLNVMVPNPNSLFFLDQNFSSCKFKDFWRKLANFFFFNKSFKIARFLHMLSSR